MSTAAISENSFLLDEPLICPVSPGSALARLCEVSGALARQSEVPATVQALQAALHASRADLLSALERGETAAIDAALGQAQTQLRALYHALSADENGAALAAALHFPAPGAANFKTRGLQSVDLSSLHVSFARFGRQVLATFAFRDVPGATAYRLREVRYIDGEKSEFARLDDEIMESYTPQFSRVRLPAGQRHFRIEARNPSTILVTDEFTLEVPEV